MEKKSTELPRELTPQSPDETKSERIGRRLVGLQRALLDLTPPLEWLRLSDYQIQPADVGRRLWEIVDARVAERQAEIEADAGEERDR
jgi:hypothetical protein